jgi:hypothetical protein
MGINDSFRAILYLEVMAYLAISVPLIFGLNIKMAVIALHIMDAKPELS